MGLGKIFLTRARTGQFFCSGQVGLAIFGLGMENFP